MNNAALRAEKAAAIAQNAAVEAQQALETLQALHRRYKFVPFSGQGKISGKSNTPVNISSQRLALQAKSNLNAATKAEANARERAVKTAKAAANARAAANAKAAANVRAAAEMNRQRALIFIGNVQEFNRRLSEIRGRRRLLEHLRKEGKNQRNAERILRSAIANMKTFVRASIAKKSRVLGGSRNETLNERRARLRRESNEESARLRRKNAAVKKIQAALRGMQVRRQLRAQAGAATRIQTAVRGMQARRRRNNAAAVNAALRNIINNSLRQT
jgi:hypothetical protein